MQVYLLRHGIAEECRAGQSDSDRELTAEGRRKLRELVTAVARAEVKPSLILTSPHLRARQTAEVAAKTLHYAGPVLESATLTPHGDPEQVWEEIRTHHDESELMLVGHDPLFSHLTGYLLNAPQLQIEFKKGAMLRLDFDGFGVRPKGVLRWFVTSRFTSGEVHPARKTAVQSRSKQSGFPD